MLISLIILQVPDEGRELLKIIRNADQRLLLLPSSVPVCISFFWIIVHLRICFFFHM